jgi:hypothetical protein
MPGATMVFPETFTDLKCPPCRSAPVPPVMRNLKLERNSARGICCWLPLYQRDLLLWVTLGELIVLGARKVLRNARLIVLQLEKFAVAQSQRLFWPEH